MKVDRSPSSVRRPRSDQVTVRPPFDPDEFARQSECQTVPPPPPMPDLDPILSSEATQEVLFVEPDTVPSLAVAREDLEWFDLSSHVRDLLHHVDGSAAIEDICARIAQPVNEGVLLVEQLIRDGLLVCR